MAGVYKLDIKEGEAELKERLRHSKEASSKERVQFLYLLKTEQAQTISQVSVMLCRNRVTVQKWAKKYREGGIAALLERKQSPGRPCGLPGWAEQALEKRLQSEEGFRSYHEIGEWLENNLGIVAPYKTVYYWAHYRLRTSPKVVRPQSSQQDTERREDFKKNSVRT